MAQMTHQRADVGGQASLCMESAPRTSRWRERLRARVTRWHCWWLLHRDDVVILDVETTGLAGLICEIAIIDTRGRILINTLVNPGIPVEQQAREVHGIDDAQLLAAPSWSKIWPSVAWALEGRTIVAYNAPFDRGRLMDSCRAAGIDPGDCASTPRWWCLMRARARIECARWKSLDGGHRALGDAQATLQLMKRMASR